MAYMMAKLNYGFDRTIDLISSKRKVQPNYGFMTQLQLYESLKFNLIGDTENHSQYMLIKRNSMLAEARYKWTGMYRVTVNV